MSITWATAVTYFPTHFAFRDLLYLPCLGLLQTIITPETTITFFMALASAKVKPVYMICFLHPGQVRPQDLLNAKGWQRISANSRDKKRINKNNKRRHPGECREQGFKVFESWKDVGFSLKLIFPSLCMNLTSFSIGTLVESL